MTEFLFALVVVLGVCVCAFAYTIGRIHNLDERTRELEDVADKNAPPYRKSWALAKR